MFVTAVLLALGWWMLFASVFGDNSKLSSSRVLKHVLISLLFIASGCGVLWYEVSAALGN